MFKNVRKEEITVPAQMSYLIQVREFIEHIGKRYRFDDKVVNSFKLVIDEACTNIIRHGYRDIKNGEITIKAIVRRLSLTILIIDQGRSYDPSKAATPDLGKYVDIGKKGGLGIMMMRKLMDDLQYSVTERGNEFRLTKYRENAHESRLTAAWHNMNLRTKYSLVAATLFTLVILSIFIPLVLGTDKDIETDVLSTAVAGSRSLAANSISSILNDDETNLFDAAVALKNNYDEVIKEVFILDPDLRVRARSNVLKSTRLGYYEIPTNAVRIDSIQNVAIFRYYHTADSANIFDLVTEIRPTTTGEGDLLGYVHVWVAEQTIDTMARSRKTNLLILMLAILTIAYLSSFFLIHRILSPFHSLADWVRQVVHGKIDQDEIDIDASDELGEIAQAFNEMTHKFRKAQVNLMEQQKLQKELQVAQEIQQMLLPSDFPKVDGYEIAAFYEAAKEVGGDLFDFVEVDEDTIGICVADVSGKGVPGSLIMTMIRTALRLESRGNKNPAEVLSKVNSFVADDMKRGMFVTMFYIVLDSRNRIIHYASAGHNPMILHRGSTKQTYYLNPSGFPVGIQLPDPGLFAAKIQTESIRLREDDILVLYTDGITEAMNTKRELFREERFLEGIRNNAHLDISDFIKSINDELKDFTGGAQQNDDITFVSIKEKLMHSEVVFRIQKELSRLINEGVKVKDALDQLRVSPYMYYKYKDIIERDGLEGLKSYLEEQDYIERKHISLEVKTKIFDVIKKNPAYGAKRIAQELEKPEYGSISIDPKRIYNELVKLRLNTRKLRERNLEKGKRTHFKQPGTPLLTLDGNVIINYESAEKEIAKRSGQAEVSLPKPDMERAHTRKEFVHTASSPSAKDSDSDQAPSTFIHKSAKPFKPGVSETPSEPEQKEDTPRPAVQPKEKEEVKQKEAEDQPVTKPAVEPIIPEKVVKPAVVPKDTEPKKPLVEPKPVPDTKAEKIIPKPQADQSVAAETAQESTPKVEPKPVQPTKATTEEKAAKIRETVDIPVPEKSDSKESLLEPVTSVIDQKKVVQFYQMINDDMTALIEIITGLQPDSDFKKDLKKITVILTIASKHPILKDITDIQLIFERSRDVFNYMHQHVDSLSAKHLINNSKDLLNCLRKDNKLDDYSKIFETINQIGLIQHKISQEITSSKISESSQMDRIRRKIAQKEIVSTRSILESLAKHEDK